MPRISRYCEQESGDGYQPHPPWQVQRGKFFLIKRPSTAAGAAGIGIPDVESLPAEAVIKVHLAAIQIFMAGRIHEKGYTITLQHLIVAFLIIEGHTVFKARASARFDENAKQLPVTSLLSFELSYLGNGTIS